MFGCVSGAGGGSADGIRFIIQDGYEIGSYGGSFDGSNDGKFWFYC